MTRLTRRTALALPVALAAPSIPRAQGSVEITVHYAQPFIFKPSYDAITEAFARAEPSIRINYVTTPSYQEGTQLLLRQAAWKFLRFATSAEGQALMVMNSGYVPCNQLAIDEPRWLAAFYRDNPRFGAAVTQMSRMAPWFAFPGANGVRITEAINNNTSRVIERRATPEAALADMAGEVRRLLPRRG